MKRVWPVGVVDRAVGGSGGDRLLAALERWNFSLGDSPPHRHTHVGVTRDGARLGRGHPVGTLHAGTDDMDVPLRAPDRS
jgi:hypothetical protein